MKTIRSLFWKIYYGKERIDRARNICGIIGRDSQGNLANFYNYKGEQIRGFYKRSERPVQLDPLIVKYQR